MNTIITYDKIKHMSECLSSKEEKEILFILYDYYSKKDRLQRTILEKEDINYIFNRENIRQR